MVVVGVGLVVTAFTPLPRRVAEWFSRAPAPAGVCSPSAPRADLDFTLKDMNGRDVRLEDYKGKVVLLNFWATWCGPCRIEIPWFVDLQEHYRDRGLRVVGISVDDPPAELAPFAHELGINYPILVGRDREDVQKAFGPIFAVPITVLIGRDGRVCVKHVGPVSKAQFESEIRALL